MKEKKRDIIFLRWLPLLLICVYVVFPIYWAINTAFKNESEILGKTVTYLPKNGTIANFVDAWTNVGFDKYFFNSLKVSGISVIFIVIISVMVGYALSRYKFKFKMAFLGLLLAVQFIPAAVLLVPLFNIFNGLGLVGSHIARGSRKCHFSDPVLLCFDERVCGRSTICFGRSGNDRWM